MPMESPRPLVTLDPLREAKDPQTGSLFPRWNSMWFLPRWTTLWSLAHWGDSRPAKFKHVTNVETCTLLWCNVLTYCAISKKFISNRAVPANTPLFLFPDIGRSLWIFALAITKDYFLRVHPENKTFFDFSILWSKNKCNLHKTWNNRCSNVLHNRYRLVQHQTDLLPYEFASPVSNGQEHGR